MKKDFYIKLRYITFFQIVIMVLLVGCFIPDTSKESAIEENSVEYGFIVLSLERLISSGKELIIEKPDGSIFAIFSKKVEFEDKKRFDFFDDERFIDEKINISAFFPDYDLFVVRAKKNTDNKFFVKMDEEWMRVNESTTFNFDFESNEEHLRNNIVKLTSGQKIFTDKQGEKQIFLEKLENYSFKVIRVEKDWIEVKCYLDCEGCVNVEIIQGWVKWSNDEELLIELFYFC